MTLLSQMPMRHLGSRLVVGATLLMATTSLAAPAAVASSTTASAPYVTLLFGRAQLAASEGCQQLPGGVTLPEIGARLALEGMAASAAVVTDRISDDVHQCVEGNLNPTWPELADLRDTDGWQFVSGGRTHAANLPARTVAAQQNEICGSLDILRAHGHNRAWGLFASKGLKGDATVERDVVSQCFAYGRTYGKRPNVQARMVEPWFQKTWSVEGGRCNQLDLPCASIAVDHASTYQSPETLSSFLQIPRGRWAVLQAYRLVEGSRTAGSVQWDCTSPDWRQHWTNQVELYCWDDYLSVVRSIPAAATVADPATVAEAWGRPGSSLPIPS